MILKKREKKNIWKNDLNRNMEACLLLEKGPSFCCNEKRTEIKKLIKEHYKRISVTV